jgi:spermidine synthase
MVQGTAGLWGYEVLGAFERCTRALDDRRAVAALAADVANTVAGRRDARLQARRASDGSLEFVATSGRGRVVATLWAYPDRHEAWLHISATAPEWSGSALFDHAFRLLRARRGRAIVHTLSPDGGYTSRRRTLDLGKTIFHQQSPFQTIELAKGPRGLALVLDGNWQFVEDTERAYHELLVHVPMACAPHHDVVGIGGGGDGLAMREVLRWRSVKRVDMYELDPLMVDVARKHPEMVRLNEGALNDPRARVVAKDARAMFDRGGVYDVLILDFPSVSDGGSARQNPVRQLYTDTFYARAAEAMTPGGVLITQSTDFKRNFLMAARNLMKAFPYVLPVDLSSWGEMAFRYVLACKQRPYRFHRLPGGLGVLSEDTLDVLGRQFSFLFAGDVASYTEDLGLDLVDAAVSAL